MKEKELDIFFDTALRAETIDRLGNDLIILENPYSSELPDFPFRSDTSISIITVDGSMECAVDMVQLKVDVPGMLVILPSQIVENISFKKGYRGYCMIMSQSFLENLPMGNKIPLMGEIRRHPFYPMSPEMTDSVMNYIHMLQGTIRYSSKYQSEIVTHLTIAYYYGLGTTIHDLGDQNKTATRYDRIAGEFMQLVRDNCRSRRDMEFYADALCLTAKHISLAVKTVTGLSATKWIERYTVLNAKSLLTTTDLSISEIADKLSFNSQSDFGKYFKKFTGMSPKAFRAGSGRQ